VGNDKIGGNKLEEMSKSDAIREFKRLFFEKTGNPWEAWEQKTIQKQPGRFFPLEIVLFLVLFLNYLFDGYHFHTSGRYSTDVCFKHLIL